MMRSIVGSSLKFQFLVITVAVALMVFGASQLPQMPVDSLPEFSPPYVEIQTEALGLSAKEVNEMITVPMEQDLLAGVAWLDVIESKSVPGLSSVVVHFEPGTDLYRGRQMVAERIAQAAVGIPHVSKPPTMIQPLSSASRFMIVGLSSKELSLIELSVLARWTIGPRLMGVPGVSTVAIWGNRDRQLQVLVDPNVLQAKEVSLDQVITTTGNALWVSPLTYLEASSPGTGGFIDTPNQRLTLWHVLPISSPEELAQVPVEDTRGLVLSDVARVVEDHQPLIGDAVINDTPNLLLVIEKLPGTNTLEVTRGIEAALEALQPGLPGVEFDATLFRPASFIEQATINLTQALVIAILLIVLVLGAFLYGWRSALISLVVIVTAMFAALVVLYLRGATLNTMVLAGLIVALGVVIDEAVIDIEHVLQRLRKNREEGGEPSAESIILEASAEMRGTMLFATMIVLLAVVPVFFIEGTNGALFQPLVVSYALAVVAAMIAALTITPALSFALLSGNGLRIHVSPLIPRLQRGYERVLSRTIKNPALATAAIAVFLAVGFVLTPALSHSQALPTFREPYVVIELESSPATSQPEMDRITARMSAEFRSIPGVQNVGAHVGRAVFGDQVVGINSAELWASIDPQVDYDATVAAIQETANGYPGLAVQVKTYLQQTLTEPMRSSPSDDITLRIFGDDMRILRAAAEKLEKSLAEIPGVSSSHVNLPVEEPTLEIEVDLDAAQHYGIAPGDVRRQAATLLSGIQVGSLFEEQKIFDVVVWGTPEIRENLTNIRDLPIETPDGNQVRLGDVADVRMVAAPTVIEHYAISGYLDVGFNVQERSPSAVASEIQAAVKNYIFPLEYHAEVLSDYATQQSAQQRLIIAGIVVLIGIFLLLQASTGSWRLAFATFVMPPAGLCGGLIAAYLGGEAVSLASLFGLLTVVGITARNGIMMINHYQRLELEEGNEFGADLIVRGSRERIAPILMTALTTGLALLPFAFFRNAPGLEIVHPMAIVILGGLVTSTLLNLFALPTLYLSYGASREAYLGFVRATAAGVASGAQD